MSDLPDNVVSLFWWKYRRLLSPKRPKQADERTTDQKIADALARWGSHKRD